MRRAKSPSISASARRVTRTIAVSITSWLVLPRWTNDAAAASCSATRAVSALHQRDRQAACGPRLGDDRLDVELASTCCRNRRDGAERDHALAGFGVGERCLEGEHRLDHGAVGEDVDHRRARQRAREDRRGHRCVAIMCRRRRAPSPRTRARSPGPCRRACRRGRRPRSASLPSRRCRRSRAAGRGAA